MRAIDVHCHKALPLPKEEKEALERYFKIQLTPKADYEIAQELIDLDIKALLIGWDVGAERGSPGVSNEEVARMVQEYPDAFLGAWAMIDPWKGKMAVKELEVVVGEWGMTGLKFQQSAQGFFPNDCRFYPLYEKCVELNIPVMFHTGTTGMGSGMPGVVDITSNMPSAS
jgi:hypothetical protein